MQNLGNPFYIGCGGLIGALLLAIAFPRPTEFQLVTFAIFIGLSSAGIATGLSGMLDIQTTWVKAGGPLAVFVFVTWSVLQYSSHSGFPAQGKAVDAITGPINPGAVDNSAKVQGHAVRVH